MLRDQPQVLNNMFFDAAVYEAIYDVTFHHVT